MNHSGKTGPDAPAREVRSRGRLGPGVAVGVVTVVIDVMTNDDSGDKSAAGRVDGGLRTVYREIRSAIGAVNQWRNPT